VVVLGAAGVAVVVAVRMLVRRALGEELLPPRVVRRSPDARLVDMARRVRRVAVYVPGVARQRGRGEGEKGEPDEARRAATEGRHADRGRS